MSIHPVNGSGPVTGIFSVSVDGTGPGRLTAHAATARPVVGPVFQTPCDRAARFGWLRGGYQASESGSEGRSRLGPSIPGSSRGPAHDGLSVAGGHQASPGGHRCPLARRLTRNQANQMTRPRAAPHGEPLASAPSITASISVDRPAYRWWLGPPSSRRAPAATPGPHDATIQPTSPPIMARPKARRPQCGRRSPVLFMVGPPPYPLAASRPHRSGPVGPVLRLSGGLAAALDRRRPPSTNQTIPSIHTGMKSKAPPKGVEPTVPRTPRGKPSPSPRTRAPR